MAYSSTEVNRVRFLVDDDGAKKLILTEPSGDLVEFTGGSGGGGSSVDTGITVDPSGLIIVSGTNVHAALSQLDAAIVARATKASPIFTGIPITPALSVTGLTGAASGARLVGATAAGAPSSGTFVVGDTIIDRSGSLYICTTAGTPGTWVRLGGAHELDYQSNTTSYAAITTTEIDILSITFTVTTKPVIVQGHCPWSGHSTTAKGITLVLTDGANTAIPNCTEGFSVAAASQYTTVDVYERIATPGTYTRKLRAKAGGGTTGAFVNTLSLGINFLKAVEF